MRRLAPIVLAALLAACGSTAQPTTSTAGGQPTASGGLSPVASTSDGVVPSAGTVPNGATTPVPSGGGGVAPDAAGTPSTPGTAVTPTARVAGPVTVGFLNTKVGNAEAFGLNTGQTYSNRAIFEALVAAMNEEGGVAGRQLVAVIADTDTAASNWEVEFAAACERFTTDTRVDAVLGYAFGLFEAFEQCLTDAGITHLSGAYTIGDVTTLEEHPLLVGTTNVVADRRYVLQLQGAVDAGLLTPEHKVGILRDDCSHSVRAHERATLPYIERADIDVVADAVMSCAHGAGDVGAVASQIQNAVLQFRSRGVDTVIAEGIPVIVFAQNAQTQGWRPRYLLTSTTGGAALEPNIPAEQAANMHGFGWFPSVDVSPSNQPPLTDGARRCIELLARQNIELTQYNDFISAFTSCDALFLFEAALEATAGRSEGAVVVEAIAELGDRYSGVSAHDGRTFFAADARDAPAAYRQWGWISECSCFQYVAPARPLGR
jgi:hypothetical protein